MGLFKRAHEWRKQTGQGLLDNGQFKSFQAGLRSLCPNWDVLEPVLGTRAGVVQLFDSDKADLINVDQNDDDIPDDSSKVE